MTNSPSTGADFFRDTAINYGEEEALGICGRYLGMQMKSEQPADEVQFCRELFAAMFEASTQKADLDKIPYPYDVHTARNRAETTVYYESRKRNIDCSKAIDAAIMDSCFKRNNYNLELAAMYVIHNHGFPRVNAVLARNLQQWGSDARFSSDNQNWAQSCLIQEKAFDAAILNSHPMLIDLFVSYIRKLCNTCNNLKYYQVYIQK